MHGRTQVPTGGHFEEFANVDHERVFDRFNVDPLILVVHLQTSSARLRVQQGQYTAVAVRTHTLRDRAFLSGSFFGSVGSCRLGGLFSWRHGRCRVADDFDERLWVVGESRGENVCGLPQAQSPFRQQAFAYGGEFFVPGVSDGFELWQGHRIQVGAGETVVGVQGLRYRFAVWADVDLFAPVHVTQRAFAAHAGVAAEVGRVGVFDAEFVFFWQGEESLSGLQEFGEVRGGDAVPGEVEEPYCVGDVAELAAEVVCVLGVVGLGEVEDWEAGQ